MKSNCKEKLNYFWKKKQAVHITRRDKTFANGNIVEVGDDFVVLNEFNRDGSSIIKFNEIFRILSYVPIEEMERNG